MGTPRAVTDAGQAQGGEPEPQEYDKGWAARRARLYVEQKTWMARYCVQHDFLVPLGGNPAHSRDTVASVLVNQGTTPNLVVAETLDWVRQTYASKPGLPHAPPDITWYTTSGLVTATLHDVRKTYPEISIATRAFLFPGRVDIDMQAVSGPEAEEFAENLEYDFRYAFLSAYAFDLADGRVRFQYAEEVRLQTACARLFAEHKFLFLDSSKFKREGRRGYLLHDLLKQARTVTIYTTASPDDASRREGFKDLAESVLPTAHDNINGANQGVRTLQLRIVGDGGRLVESFERTGFLASTRATA